MRKLTKLTIDRKLSNGNSSLFGVLVRVLSTPFWSEMLIHIVHKDMGALYFLL